MYKAARLAGACAVIYLLSFGLGAAVTGTGGSEVTASVTTDSGAVTETAEPAYIVKERDGFVAVFDRDSGELKAATEISVAGLRSGDRQLVARGIEVENYSEVLCLLEDLGS